MVSLTSISGQSSRQSFDVTMSLVPRVSASKTAGLNPDRDGPPWMEEWPTILPAIANKSDSKMAVHRFRTRCSLCPSKMAVTPAFPKYLSIDRNKKVIGDYLRKIKSKEIGEQYCPHPLLCKCF